MNYEIINEGISGIQEETSVTAIFSRI